MLLARSHAAAVSTFRPATFRHHWIPFEYRFAPSNWLTDRAHPKQHAVPDVLALTLNTLINAMVVFMEYQLVGWHSRTSGRVRAQGTRNGRNKELPITASCVRSAKRIMHGGIRLRAAYSDDKAARLTSPLFKSLSKRPPPPMMGHRRRSLPEQSCQSASGHFPGEPERLK